MVRHLFKTPPRQAFHGQIDVRSLPPYCDTKQTIWDRWDATDDTLILATEEFSKLEEDELVKAKLIAKLKEKLAPNAPLLFNGCTVSIDDSGTICLRQKGQGNKLALVDEKHDTQTVYRQQRARAAFISSICQPEAAFDLSAAAQTQEPNADEVKALNKRISWHMANLDRGLRYLPIELKSAKLFVFVDGSFANNKDFSSQFGYEIIIANETTGDDEFEIQGNLIHWSSTKSKRVTRSVLASEIYGMVGGVDMSLFNWHYSQDNYGAVEVT